jgi:hypothetical protein
MTTNVYVTNNLGSPVSLQLEDGGPDTLNQRLAVTSVQQNASSVIVARIPRTVDGLFTLDLAFLLAGAYVASLGLLIDGGGLTSWIWYRWRTAQDALPWISDRDAHVGQATAAGTTYSITVQGQASFLGFDDVAVTLSAG